MTRNLYREQSLGSSMKSSKEERTPRLMDLPSNNETQAQENVYQIQKIVLWLRCSRIWIYLASQKQSKSKASQKQKTVGFFLYLASQKNLQFFICCHSWLSFVLPLRLLIATVCEAFWLAGWQLNERSVMFSVIVIKSALWLAPDLAPLSALLLKCHCMCLISLKSEKADRKSFQLSHWMHWFGR